MKIKTIVFFLPWLVLPVFSQSQNWQLTLANGRILSDVMWVKLEGDSVLVSSGSSLVRCFLIDSIAEVRKINQSRFWKGAGIGLITGAAAGALIGRSVYQPSNAPHGEFFIDFGPGINALAGGVLGGLAGIITGGLIGAAAGADEVHDFSESTQLQKLQTVRSIILKDQSKENDR
jgi:hypothetical protein